MQVKSDLMADRKLMVRIRKGTENSSKGSKHRLLANEQSGTSRDSMPNDLERRF